MTTFEEKNDYIKIKVDTVKELVIHYDHND